MIKFIFRYYKNLLKVILILICCLAAVTAAYASNSNRLFYETPTLETLLGKLKEVNKLEDDRDSDSAAHVNKLVAVQVTFALKAHIGLSKEVISNLGDLPEQIKPAVVQGLVNTFSQDIKENIGYNFTPQPLVKEINNFKFIYPSNNSKKCDHNLKGADYLWAAFYSTGNKDYILRIITFLNKFPLKIRTLAAEATNREALQAGTEYLTEKEDPELAYSDIMKNLSAEERYQFNTYKIISWSLSSNRKQYHAIDAIVKEIFNSNSDLDFYKDIKL